LKKSLSAFKNDLDHSSILQEYYYSNSQRRRKYQGINDTARSYFDQQNEKYDTLQKKASSPAAPIVASASMRSANQHWHQTKVRPNDCAGLRKPKISKPSQPSYDTCEENTTAEALSG
jgi:hypothetical protein